jgi:hypothetical protein
VGAVLGSNRPPWILVRLSRAAVRTLASAAAMAPRERRRRRRFGYVDGGELHVRHLQNTGSWRAVIRGRHHQREEPVSGDLVQASAHWRAVRIAENEATLRHVRRSRQDSPWSVRPNSLMNDILDFRTRLVTSNDTRVPEPTAGEAIVVGKYGGGRRKAVILHPDDFDLFMRYRRLFGCVPHELRLSETAITAHRVGERGETGEALDVDSVRQALA